MTAAAWAPDGESFVTAALDVSSQLCHWGMRGQTLYMWPEGFRVQDCAITPDGRRLIAADLDQKVHVYNLATRDEEYCLALKSKPTSVAVSRDSRHMLINSADGQIQLVDINTTDVVRRFSGQKQGHFVIRSVFGGAAENFIVSGSEGEHYLNTYPPSLANCTRFSCLYLSQRSRHTCGGFRGACTRMCKFHVLESPRPRNVCFCWRRLLG